MMRKERVENWIKLGTFFQKDWEDFGTNRETIDMFHLITGMKEQERTNREGEALTILRKLETTLIEMGKVDWELYKNGMRMVIIQEALNDGDNEFDNVIDILYKENYELFCTVVDVN